MSLLLALALTLTSPTATAAPVIAPSHIAAPSFFCDNAPWFPTCP